MIEYMGSQANLKTTSGDVSNGKDSTMLEKPLIADVRDDNYVQYTVRAGVYTPKRST